MAWLARSKLRGLLRPSRARRAVRAALGWRLWVIGLLTVIAAQWTSLLLPALAAIVSLTTWTGLSLQACRRLDLTATDPRNSRRHRILSFSAGLFVSVGFLLATIGCLVACLDRDLRVPIVVALTTAVAATMAWIMLHRWWSIGYMVTGSAAVVAVAFFTIWQTVEHELPIAAGWVFWLRSAGRLACVFGALGLFEAFCHRRPWSRRQRQHLIEGGIRTAAFVAILAAIDRMPDATNSMPERILNAVLFVGAALGTLDSLIRAFPAALADLCWAWSLGRNGWERSGSPPAELFLALAFAPPLLLAPISDWTTWLLSLALALVAAMLKLANDRWRGWRKPIRARKSAPALPPTMEINEPRAEEPLRIAM